MSATHPPEKSTLRTKARSLDNLHQVSSITIQPIKVKFDPSKNINYMIDRHNSDEDDDDDDHDDDDNESVLHTRL